MTEVKAVPKIVHSGSVGIGSYKTIKFSTVGSGTNQFWKDVIKIVPPS